MPTRHSLRTLPSQSLLSADRSTDAGSAGHGSRVPRTASGSHAAVPRDGRPDTSPPVLIHTPVLTQTPVLTRPPNGSPPGAVAPLVLDDPRVAEVRARLDSLIEPHVGGDLRVLSRIREVVIIASSSRGGSSFFAELLRLSDRLLHFPGEINPALKLAGLTFPNAEMDSDTLTAAHAERARELNRYFAWEIGGADLGLHERADYDLFARHLCWRLTLQWPAVVFDPNEVSTWMFATLEELERSHGWRPGEFSDVALFHVLFLRRVRARNPEVNPYYYDLPERLIREHDPDVPMPEGPPADFVVEETPYVTIRPWRRATEEDLSTRPLVIKTPSNAYRLPFLRALFPNARVRVFHLTRNAAASVNGLYEGWRYRGFYSHPVDPELALERYSDEFPEWGRRWWNFDLPPGWEEWTTGSLVETCGFQWRSAHEAILADAAATADSDYLRLTFEDVGGDSTARGQFLQRFSDWLDRPFEPAFLVAAGNGLAPVMATSRPEPDRWRKIRDQLSPVLRDPRIIETMIRLGYGSDPSTWT